MKQFKDMKRIVIKVGSSTLSHAHGGLNLRKIDQLAMVLSDLKNSGKEIVLVTSGAVSAGMAKLQMSKRPSQMREKQLLPVLVNVSLCLFMINFSRNTAQRSHSCF